MVVQPIWPASCVFIFGVVFAMAASMVRFAEVSDHQRGRADRGDRVDAVLAGPVGRGAADGLVHRDAALVGVEVAAGGDAEAALARGAEIGDDVAEHVVRDDDVELAGILDHQEADRVDVAVRELDGRILLRHLLGGALPEAEDVREDVRLAAEREARGLAGGLRLGGEAAERRLLRVALLRELERVAEAAVDLEAVVDPLLRGDLLRRALHHDAAHARVDAARVLADDDVVHRLGRDAGDGRRDAGVELDGAQVDVLVEIEAELEEDVLLEDAGGDVLRAGAGEADGAEVDGVELAELGLVRLVDELARLEVVLAAEGEDLRLEAELELLGGGLEDLEALADHFGTGAVAGDDCDVVGFHGWVVRWLSGWVVECHG